MADQIHFDELGKISAVKFHTLDADMKWTFTLGDVNNAEGTSMVPAGAHTESDMTYMLGLRTTKECFQDRTIKSIRFIYASLESSVCDKLDLINRDNVR